MCGSHGMDVAIEVQVDDVARQDLRQSAARGPSFHSEDRSERGFAQCDGGAMAEPCQRLRKTDRDDRLALAIACRRDGCDQNQPTVPLGPAEKFKPEFGRVAAVVFHVLSGDLQFVGDLSDQQHMSANLRRHHNARRAGWKAVAINGCLASAQLRNGPPALEAKLDLLIGIIGS